MKIFMQAMSMQQKLGQTQNVFFFTDITKNFKRIAIQTLVCMPLLWFKNVQCNTHLESADKYVFPLHKDLNLKFSLTSEKAWTTP